MKTITKVATSVLALASVAAVSVAGTLAYLSDRASAANVFTYGNVEIELNEEFEQGAQLLPGVDIEKTATITNTGKTDAWVWATIAIPAALDNEDASKNAVHFNYNAEDVGTGKWTWKDQSNAWMVAEDEINDVKYNVYTILYQSALEEDETTPPVMTKVYMDYHIDIDPDGNLHHVENGVVEDIDWNIYEDGSPIIYVNAYGVQADENIDSVWKAYETYGEQWGENAGKIEGVTATSVSTADELAAAVANGGAVVLNNDIAVTSTINIASGVETELILNGNTLSYAVDNNGASAVINNKGDLTIGGTGTITFTAADPDLKEIPSYATNTITNTGTLTINDGITVENHSDGGASYAVDVQSGTFVFNGGVLKGESCALRIARFNADTSFEMNGGTVIAATPAWIHLPGSNANAAPGIDIVINDGTFQSTKDSSADNDALYTYSFGNSHANTSITINGGEFLGGTVSIGAGYKGDAPTLNITGGTFEYDVLQWLENDASSVLYEANMN